MYYSAAEMAYVEGQRMKRIMEEAAIGRLDLVKDEDGIYRYRKNGKNWEPVPAVRRSV